MRRSRADAIVDLAAAGTTAAILARPLVRHEPWSTFLAAVTAAAVALAAGAGAVRPTRDRRERAAHNALGGRRA